MYTTDPIYESGNEIEGSSYCQKAKRFSGRYRPIWVEIQIAKTF